MNNSLGFAEYGIVSDVLFLMTFLVVPAVAFFLLRYAGISLRTFTLPSFFVLSYLVTAYAGISVMYFGRDGYAWSLGIQDGAIILSMLLYSSAALILIIFGFVFAYQMIGLRATTVRYQSLIPSSSKQRIFIFFLFLLCFAVLLVYLRQVDSIALLEALEGDVVGAAVARSNMGSNFQGDYWRYSLFFRVLLDYCVLFFFADYLIHRRMRRRGIARLILFAASFLIAAVSATMSIEKGPFIGLVLMLYLSYIMVKGGRYWQPAAKYWAVFGVSALTVFYIIFMGTSDVASALGFMWERILTGQIFPAYVYLEQFPTHIDFLWGATLPNPGGLLPFESFPLTTTMAEVIYPGDYMSGIVGTMPTVFWAEVYVNFGPMGLIFGSFLIGIGLFTVSHVLARLPRSAPAIAATAFLAMHYQILTATGFSNYLFDIVLIAIATVTLILLVLGLGHRPRDHALA